MKDLLGKWNGLKAETRRFLKFLAIPLVAVILIMAVVVLDKAGQPANEPKRSLPRRRVHHRKAMKISRRR